MEADPFIALETDMTETCISGGDCNAVRSVDAVLSERHLQRVIELLIPGIYFILLGIRYALMYNRLLSSSYSASTSYSWASGI